MKLVRGRKSIRGWRWHIEFSHDTWAVCFWVPWRQPGEPLVYWWKYRPR